MCVYKYVCVCMYVCMYVWIHTHTHTVELGYINVIGMLLVVNAVIDCKCKLQLKFRNNKNYSFVVVNISTGLR
jgi:hypothetical protein